MNKVVETLQGATLEREEESIASDDVHRDLRTLGSKKTASSRTSLLPEDKERESEHSISNFESIIHLSVGNVGMGVLTLLMRNVINIFLCLSQIGSMAVYALFIAQNLQPIFQHYGGEIFENLSNRVYITMVLPFMIALCSIRSLSYLSPFSILANILQGGSTGYITRKRIIYRLVHLVEDNLLLTMKKSCPSV